MAKDLTNVKNINLIGIGNFELKGFFVHYMIQLWTKMANSKLVYYGKTMLYGLGKHKCLMSFVKCIYSFFLVPFNTENNKLPHLFMHTDYYIYLCYS